MKILVLAGGTSAEREVSLDSGQCVVDALRGRGHEVDLIDPASTVIRQLDAGMWDIALPMVHGTGGEDGTLQRDLNQIRLNYVGSSATASQLTFNKIHTNQLLRQHNVPTPENRVLQIIDSRELHLDAISELGLPVVTKPPCEGSSVGITIVHHEHQVDGALQKVFDYGNECLVESYIAGRELTVPVINGQATPVVEIMASADWYDYDAKYHDDRTRYAVNPVDINDDISVAAVRACDICNVTGIARVDFRLSPAGKIFLLEINTIPGMTSHSLVPKSAAAIGLSLADICELAIEHQLSQRSRISDSSVD